jgi:hypothetical protein
VNEAPREDREDLVSGMGQKSEEVRYEPRMTHREWRGYVRDKRAWDRRAVVATAAVLAAEVAVAAAWAAWTSVMATPRPKARG